MSLYICVYTCVSVLCTCGMCACTTEEEEATHMNERFGYIGKDGERKMKGGNDVIIL